MCYKEHELLALHNHQSSPRVFDGVRVTHVFIFFVLYFCFVCILSSVSCVQCCLCSNLVLSSGIHVVHLVLLYVFILLVLCCLCLVTYSGVQHFDIFTFLVPCCDFCIRTMFGSSLPPVVCRRLMSYLCYLCILASNFLTI